MTALEFLEDTVKYFSEDVSRRCVEITDAQLTKCTYAPQNKEQTGCAIGRHLTPTAQEILDMENNISIHNVFERRDVESLLPDWMLKIEPEVLMKVQNLHDFANNWTSRGLSVRGEQTVKSIKLLIEEYESK